MDRRRGKRKPVAHHSRDEEKKKPTRNDEAPIPAEEKWNLENLSETDENSTDSLEAWALKYANRAPTPPPPELNANNNVQIMQENWENDEDEYKENIPVVEDVDQEMLAPNGDDGIIEIDLAGMEDEEERLNEQQANNMVLLEEAMLEEEMRDQDDAIFRAGPPPLVPTSDIANNVNPASTVATRNNYFTVDEDENVVSSTTGPDGEECQSAENRQTAETNQTEGNGDSAEDDDNLTEEELLQIAMLLENK